MFITSPVKRLFPLLLIPLSAFYSCNSPGPDRVNHESLAIEMQDALIHNLLEAWYPRSIDSVYGGFLSDFNADWEEDGAQYKMIVTQARHVWTSSHAFLFLGDSAYLEIAHHGFHFLKDKMWDHTRGGFYFILARESEFSDHINYDHKSLYGNAFAIYALAAYYKASGNEEALDLARKTFFWLEEHSHDPVRGGYFEHMKLTGELYSDDDVRLNDDELRVRHWKDYNSSIHFLEACTELYSVWPDSLLRERTLEMLTLIRDTMADPRGYLQMFFTGDWQHISYRDSTPVSHSANFYYDHVSFGHDVETAYLMLEAEEVLGIAQSGKTAARAKSMVDHALSNGWDNRTGGLYDAGYYFRHSDTLQIIRKDKIWWSQAEALNAFLYMSVVYPGEEKYFNAFLKQWDYIRKYLIDSERGGWYQAGLDYNPEAKDDPKASVWKVNYHNGRSLMNCIRKLNAAQEVSSEP